MEREEDRVFREVEETFGQVPTWMRQLPPEMREGFWSTMRDLQLAETAIPNKYKELIGLAVSGATRCRYCAFFHTEAARFYGATEEEIREASAMAAETMSASTFLNAQQIDHEEFIRQTREMLEYVQQHQESGESRSAGPDASVHA